MAASKGRAARQDDVLTLKTGRGQLRFKDTPCDLPNGKFDTDCKSYSLYADLPSRHAYLVMQGHSEGFDVWLIDDRTGLKTVLEEVPLFSPDSSELVTVNTDKENDPVCEFQVWRRVAGNLKSEWCLNPRNLPVHDAWLVRWTRPNEIEVLFTPYDTLEHPDVEWRGRLVRSGSKWRLVTTAPKLAPTRPR